MKRKFKVKSSSLKVQKKEKHFHLAAFCLLICAFCLLISSDIFADEKIELTLGEAINISLRENLSLTEERINPKIAAADIKFREGEFDPGIELKTTASYKKAPTPSILIGTEDRTLDADASFGGKINTGTAYELKWTNERAESNLGFLTINPYYSSELALTFTQPLLKGLGKEVQESNLNISKNNLEISKLNLDDKAAGIIADTSSAYWDLAFARYDLDVSELSLKLAKNLLNEVKAKIESGFFAPVEIYKAEAEVSLREETLLRSGKTVFDAADRLRVVMNLKDWQSELIPIEKTPSPSEIQPVEDAIDAALKNRRDYKQALIDRKNKEILRKYFDNQRYPDINVIGSVGLNGLNGTYEDALEKLGSNKYYSWQVGLSFRMPLGNRAAEGNYLKAKNDEEKSEIELSILEQKITAEIREAWRAVNLATESINASKKTRIASEKRLAAEEDRFKAGMATVNDVLKFQEEYAKALSSERKAEVNYAEAVVGLEKAKGALTMP